jgi:hypothetical protein
MFLLTRLILFGPGTASVRTDGCFGSSGKISIEEKHRICWARITEWERIRRDARGRQAIMLECWVVR